MPHSQDHQRRHFEESENRLRVAEHLIDLLWRDIQPASVLDVGCGVGFWLKAFERKGVSDLCGVDGDWLVPELMVAKAHYIKADLEKPLNLHLTFDLVMSIEVGEHIRQEYCSNFVRSLVTHGNVILFSAAIRGQGGQGHVNEQYLQYWVDRFATHGYRPFDLIRPLIWNDSSIYLYLRQNVIVFANKNALALHPCLRQLAGVPSLISVIHPEYYDRELKARRN